MGCAVAEAGWKKRLRVAGQMRCFPVAGSRRQEARGRFPAWILLRCER